MNQAASLFLIVVGCLTFFSFTTFCFCLSTLRREIDGQKLRGEPHAARISHALVPPGHVLTKKGKTKVTICQATLFATAVGVALIIAYCATGGTFAAPKQ